MQSRRDFLRQSSALGGLWLLEKGGIKESGTPQSGRHITFLNEDALVPASPLQKVELTVSERGKLTILDGWGRPYVESEVEDGYAFDAGGALGRHVLLLQDRKDRLIDHASFMLDTSTHITDTGGTYTALMDRLYWTMVKGGATDTVRIGGKFYHFFVRWLRDHVHTLKGMQYFHPDLKSAIDLYADTQREDGMIWDNVQERNKEKNWWDKRFRYGDFIRDVEEGTFELKRIPIEADVEYLFVEGLYKTWQATGDDHWMTGHLDAALQAIAYCTTDPYRWSEKYQLIKRGFTIDTWDFQSDQDAELVGGDIMVVDLEKSRFGVMFGDNTGLASSCEMLAKMLRYAGRTEESARVAQLGADVMQQTMERCWNGEFFVHHIPEDEDHTRYFGVDQDTQISLSNAYSLNRPITQSDAASIIGSYQRIREEMPESSPGEWYTVYPPFPKGFEKPAPEWEYMNGGVSSIVAGELARGALSHGFESYGVSILKRVGEIAAESDGFLPCVLRGKAATPPERVFEALNLAVVANAAFPGDDATFEGKRLVDEASEGEIRIREFRGIPFEIIDPEANEQMTAIELWQRRGHTDKLALPIGTNTSSIYLLHTGQGRLAGRLTILYDDDGSHTVHIDETTYGNWWHLPERVSKSKEICQKAWRSDSNAYVGLYVFGIDNPRPLRDIRAITLEAAGDGDYPWRIVAISLCDAPLFLDPGPVSYGIPHNWGAAAVMAALVEGLAGIKDSGVALDTAVLSPRWSAAGEEVVMATAKYEASGGYLAYAYLHEEEPQRLTVRFTGSMNRTRVECLLPDGFRPDRLRIDGDKENVELRTVGESVYACCDVDGIGVHVVEIDGEVT